MWRKTMPRSIVSPFAKILLDSLNPHKGRLLFATGLFSLGERQIKTYPHAAGVSEFFWVPAYAGMTVC